MCGILLIVSCGAARLQFWGSVLQLRGAAPSSSPLVDPATGNVLLFNGQIFGGLAVPPLSSDALLLLQTLSQPGADVPAVLTALQGPWALVFWQQAARTLWFGRDAIGRRSLLLHLPRPEDGRLVLASAAPLDPAVPFQGFAELPPGLYRLQLTPPATGDATAIGPGSSRGSGSSSLACYRRVEWADSLVLRLAEFGRAAELVAPPEGRPAQAGVTVEAGVSADALPPAAAAPADSGGPAEDGGHAALHDADEEVAQFEQAVDSLLAALRRAVAVRCRCIEERTQPAGQRAADHAGHVTVATAAPRPGDHPPASPLLPAAPVLILFSGGADSTLLAALAHEELPPHAPIDLACICFNGGASPDRLAALDALRELRAAAPGRCWRLIQVDCGLADVEARRGRLLRLLAPADTVMDLNIGAALWLAARGEGTLAEEQAGGPPQQAVHEGGPAGALAPGPGSCSGRARRVRSAARVVLLGHGADELCGGYGRHRTAFRAGGWAGLEAELALDMRRLWLRNLGRDDRLVADHGREARHPFLDEGVVAAVLAAPLPCMADLRLPPGQGDKRALRACLRRLGLPRAAARVKRAIQFGSRLARLTNAAEFGSTRRANQHNAGSVRLGDVPGRTA